MLHCARIRRAESLLIKEGTRCFGASALFRSIREKKYRRICPYDEITLELQGGLLNPPKWYNSLKKYPPEITWRKPGELARPANFYMDRVRKLMYKNRERPRWVHSIKTSTDGQLPDAFQTRMNTVDQDHEFAQCQAWFMNKYGMDEESAFRNAKYKLRDFDKQKYRVWEVYSRKKMNVGSDFAIEKLMEKSLENEASQKLKKQRRVDNHTLQAMRMNLIAKNEAWLKIHTSLKQKLLTKENLEQHLRSLEVADTDDDKEKLRKQYETQVTKQYVAQRLMEMDKFLKHCDFINKNPQLGIKDPTDLLYSVAKTEDEKRRLMAINQQLLQRMASPELPSDYTANDQDELYRYTRQRREIRSTMTEEDQFLDIPEQARTDDFYFQNMDSEFANYNDTDEFEATSEQKLTEKIKPTPEPMYTKAPSIEDEDAFDDLEEFSSGATDEEALQQFIRRSDISIEEKEEALLQLEQRKQQRKLDDYIDA